MLQIEQSQGQLLWAEIGCGLRVQAEPCRQGEPYGVQQGYLPDLRFRKGSAGQLRVEAEVQLGHYEAVQLLPQPGQQLFQIQVEVFVLAADD